MACQYGRKLQSNEVVHHIDGNKLNNDISNLKVLSISEHNRIHATESQNLKKYIENHGPWNKGKVNCYSDETLKKMSESAKEKHKTHKINSMDEQR